MCRRRSRPRRHVIVWSVKLELQTVWLVVVRKLVPQCVCNSGYLCGGLVYDPVAFNAGSEVNWNV